MCCEELIGVASFSMMPARNRVIKKNYSLYSNFSDFYGGFCFFPNLIAA